MSELPTEIFVQDTKRDLLVRYRQDYSTAIPFSARTRQARANNKPFTDKKLGVIVPLVREHYNGASWAIYRSFATRYTWIENLAVVSPSFDERGISGIAGPDQDFTDALNGLVYNGITVLGYINTLGGTKTIGDVKGEIDNWRSWFRGYVSGIFFDDSDDNSNSNRSDALAYYKELSRYAKPGLTMLNLADNKPMGEATRDENRGFWLDTDLDIIQIYGSIYYPTEQVINQLKKDWMKELPRSRFFMSPWNVAVDSIPCINFIDQIVGIERLAGYVYISNFVGYFRDNRPISALAEITMDRMSDIARQEHSGGVGTRGVSTGEHKPAAPDPTDKLITEQQYSYNSEEHMPREGTVPPVSRTIDRMVDDFGITMVYPTKEGGSIWKMNMRDPTKDKHLSNVPKLKLQDNGLWTAPSVRKVRLEGWSLPKKPFTNYEVTGFFKPRRVDGDFVIELAGRGGSYHKDMKKWGEGSALKVRLLMTGEACAVKEIHHTAETGNRGITTATLNPIIDRFIGLKAAVYNYNVSDDTGVKTGKVGVAIEIHINDNCTDEQGNLVPTNNNWRPVATIRDEPDNNPWKAKQKYTKKTGKGFITNNKFKSLDVNSKSQYRQIDEIITKPGGNEAGENCVSFSWNGEVDFGYLSGREILIQARD